MAEKLKVKFDNVFKKIDNINTSYFVSGLTAVFVCVFFISVYFLDKDFNGRFVTSIDKSSQMLEIYSLDTPSINIPSTFEPEIKPQTIHIIDIKADDKPMSIMYSKVGETVQFNNLTDTDVVVSSVQGEDLKLEIPSGTGASTVFYNAGIFYYKLSDDRVGQVYIEE